MSDRLQTSDRSLETLLATDPRVTESYVRKVDADGTRVVLVGVVHDHPASVYRAAAIVEAVDPQTVAVELPGLLVPTVRSAAATAGEDDVETSLGGEMTAAIAASRGAVAGIDVPGRGTLRSVVATLQAEGVGLRTAARTLGDIGRITVHAVGGRIAGLGLPGTPSVDGIEDSHDYDVSSDALPAEQAEHERTHLRRSTTLLRSFEPPPATALLDEIRERQMARRIATASTAGPVVAVVGHGHLEAVEGLLENRVD